MRLGRDVGVDLKVPVFHQKPSLQGPDLQANVCQIGKNILENEPLCVVQNTAALTRGTDGTGADPEKVKKKLRKGGVAS